MIAFCRGMLKEVMNLDTRLTSRLFRLVIVASVSLMRIACLSAQSIYTPGEVADGHRIYLASCAACHGPEGEAIPGVTLGQGKFRRTSSDNDLVQIIRNGIAGTAMPPGNFSAVTRCRCIAN